MATVDGLILGPSIVVLDGRDEGLEEDKEDEREAEGKGGEEVECRQQQLGHDHGVEWGLNKWPLGLDEGEWNVHEGMDEGMDEEEEKTPGL